MAYYTDPVTGKVTQVQDTFYGTEHGQPGQATAPSQWFEWGNEIPGYALGDSEEAQTLRALYAINALIPWMTPAAQQQAMGFISDNIVGVQQIDPKLTTRLNAAQYHKYNATTPTVSEAWGNIGRGASGAHYGGAALQELGIEEGPWLRRLGDNLEGMANISNRYQARELEQQRQNLLSAAPNDIYKALGGWLVAPQTQAVNFVGKLGSTNQSNWY
jgi:hypothetical protein